MRSKACYCLLLPATACCGLTNGVMGGAQRGRWVGALVGVDSCIAPDALLRQQRSAAAPLRRAKGMRGVGCGRPGGWQVGVEPKDPSRVLLEAWSGQVRSILEYRGGGSLLRLVPIISSQARLLREEVQRGEGGGAEMGLSGVWGEVVGSVCTSSRSMTRHLL